MLEPHCAVLHGQAARWLRRTDGEANQTVVTVDQHEFVPLVAAKVVPLKRLAESLVDADADGSSGHQGDGQAVVIDSGNAAWDGWVLPILSEGQADRFWVNRSGVSS
jgi:hypothetical protein